MTSFYAFKRVNYDWYVYCTLKAIRFPWLHYLIPPLI
nr:MAG TPA: hypothetical protein [Caudoviricetes sp.]